MILQRQIRQQTAHTLQLRIARQINLQRSDRSLTVLHRIKIRAFITILHRTRRADPIHRLAPRILKAVQILRRMTTPQTRDRHTIGLQLAKRQIRNIHIPQKRLTQTMQIFRQNLLHNHPRHLR